MTNRPNSQLSTFGKLPTNWQGRGGFLLSWQLVLLIFFSGCSFSPNSGNGRNKAFDYLNGSLNSNWGMSWSTREQRQRESKELIRKAYDLGRTGKYSPAISLLEQAKEKTPTDPEVFLALGKLLKENNQLEQSQLEIQNGLLFDPDSVSLNQELIAVLIQKKDYLSALKNTEQSLSTDPQNPELLRYKLLALEKLDRFQEAIGTGYKLLSVLPNDFSTKESLCRMYLRIGKPRHGWNLLQQLITAYKPNPLPSQIRQLEVQTLLAMHRNSDAALCLQRWYQEGGAVDPLWKECVAGGPNFLKQSAAKYLTQPTNDTIPSISGTPSNSRKTFRPIRF